MPGAVSAVPSISAIADTTTSSYLQPGTYKISRVKDLRYQPSGLNYGETCTGTGAVYNENEGNGTQAWQTSDHHTLDYYGDFATTGDVSFQGGLFDNDRDFAAWNVPTNCHWDVLNFGVNTSAVGGSGMDVLVYSGQMIGGSATKDKLIRTTNGSFFQVAAGSGSYPNDTKNLLSYMGQQTSDTYVHVLSDMCLLRHITPGSSVFVATSGNLGTGHQILKFWILVDEKPAEATTITVEIDNEVPIVGGDGVHFTLSSPQIIKWTNSVSGLYQISKVV